MKGVGQLIGFLFFVLPVVIAKMIFGGMDDKPKERK